MASFGRKEVSGTTTDNTVFSYRIGSRFYIPERGQITSFSTIISAIIQGGVQMALYSDNAGTPSQLIAKSDAVQVSTYGQYDFPLPTLPVVDAGYYWIALRPTANPTGLTISWHQMMGTGFRYHTSGNDGIDDFPAIEIPQSVLSGVEMVVWGTYNPMINELTVTVSPTNSTIPVNDTITLQANVSGGTAPYNYQWYKNQAVIVGASSSMLVVIGEAVGVFPYDCIVTDANNVAATGSAQVSVQISVSEVIFHPCDTLTYNGFQNKSSTFIMNGQAPYGELVVVNQGSVMPDGSSAPSPINGSTALIRGQSGFMSPNVRQCCNFYYTLVNGAGDWDLTGFEKISVWIYTNRPNWNIEVSLATAEPDWNGYSLGTILSTSLLDKQWQKFSFDGRISPQGLPDFTKVKGVILYVQGLGTGDSLDVTQGYVCLGQILVAPATGSIPLNCQVSPLNISVQKGSIANFSGKVWGGTGNYTVQWLLNGEVKKTENLTSSLPNASVSTTFAYTTSVTGTMKIKIIVVDANTTMESSEATLLVTNPPPVPVACRPLHIEGGEIKDDMGNVVRLMGVNRSSGYTASCTGDWEEDGTGQWVGAYTGFTDKGVIDRVNQMRASGFNAVRFHMFVDWWLYDMTVNLSEQTTTTSMRQAMRRAVEICNQYGMYCIFDIYGTGRDPWTSNASKYDQVPYPVPTPTFPTDQSFADYWRDFAVAFTDLPCAIFELWNEPVGTEASWWTAVQAATQAIRAVSNNLIVVQYGYCGDFAWVPTQHSIWGAMAGNILYSNHIYRQGTYSSGMYATFPEDFAFQTTTDIKTTLLDFWHYNVLFDGAGKLKYPVYIGEIGARKVAGSDETLWFKNTLAVLNEWRMSYTAWDWDHPAQQHALQDSTNTVPFPPNINGIAFMEAVESSTPQITMTLAVAGNGSVDIGTGTQIFNIGDTVQITAIPQSDATFNGWKLDGIDYSTENPLQLLVTADLNGKTLTANFTTPIQAGFPIWTLIPAGVIGAWYLLKGKKKRKSS